MLSEKQIVFVLRGTADTLFKQNSVWLGKPSTHPPDYTVRATNCQLCTLNRSDSAIARKCAAFYRSKQPGEATCPFGVSVFTHEVDIGSATPATLHLQTSINPRAMSDSIAHLPRKSKKIARERFEASPNVCREFKESQLDMLKSTAEALAMSRVATAIQAVSHDILTPVQGAIADVERLRSAIECQESSNRFIDRLTINVNTVSRLAKKIGLLLSPNQWMDVKRYRSVTVHNMLHALNERFASVAHDRSVKANIGYNAGRKQVHAIPDLLEIVLGNLLENAIKYAYANTEVHVDFESAPQHLVITFKNLGVRIEDDEIEEGLIFELGYRGRHSRDRQRRGTGSGLHVTKQIVAGHGGSIEVISIPASDDQDSTIATNIFKLYWPLYRPE